MPQSSFLSHEKKVSPLCLRKTTIPLFYHAAILYNKLVNVKIAAEGRMARLMRRNRENAGSGKVMLR